MFLYLYFSESRTNTILLKRNIVSEHCSREVAQGNVCRKLFGGGRLLFTVSKSGSDGSWRLTKPMRFPSVRWILPPACFFMQKHLVGLLNAKFVSKSEQELSPLYWKDNSVTLCTLSFPISHIFHGFKERKLCIVKAKNHFRQQY